MAWDYQVGDEVFVAGKVTAVSTGGLVKVTFGSCGSLEIEPELIGSVNRPKRYCDECERHVESERWTQVEEDEVCRQLCHRHFQE